MFFPIIARGQGWHKPIPAVCQSYLSRNKVKSKKGILLYKQLKILVKFQYMIIFFFLFEMYCINVMARGRPQVVKQFERKEERRVHKYIVCTVVQFYKLLGEPKNVIIYIFDINFRADHFGLKIFKACTGLFKVLDGCLFI